MKQILIALLFSLSSSFFHQSQPEALLQGTVTDAVSGKGIDGATITIKNEGSSTTSDSAGHFAIAVAGASGRLLCHAAGYRLASIEIKAGQTNVAIRLYSLSKNLEEVAATGYGIMMDRKIEYSRRSAPRQLQGRVPGLMIGKGSSRNNPSGSATIEDNTEEYAPITENRFLHSAENPLSTFSIDVDGASYSNVRRFLNAGQLPPAGSVRVEEMINYFHYDYPQPANADPFSITTEIGACPWNSQHQLVTVGLQGRKIPTEKLPAANLVFLIDVSGSMMVENKLPLVKSSLKLLVDQLREKDRVAIVVYAGNAGLVLPSTQGSNKEAIHDAIASLEAGGSTAGGEGIRLAYQVARDNFIPEANNRVILCTDGDFNVGASSDADMEHLIESERKSGIFLTVLGYGMGNYKDSKMQLLADKGNGNHAYIDNLSEARKVLVSEFGGTLFTIAKDVKLQVEFNPARVQAYRLVGYENRLLNKEDFNNDEKDAGELGSGHTVTALYELIPVGVKNEFEEKVDSLKYQQRTTAIRAGSNELMTIKFRYKKPGSNTSELITHVVATPGTGPTSKNFNFVASVAEFGMLLNRSEFRQQASFADVLSLAKHGLGSDREGYRKEFITLAGRAEELMDNKESSLSQK